MKAILINYRYTPDWLKSYDFDYIIYDRSEEDEWLKDFPKNRIIKTRNIGNADYDRISYLVDNYYNLPDIFLWSKSNLFKYISKEEFDALDKTKFQPLLTQHHKTYEPVCRYVDGIYEEINNSWYLGSQPSIYYRNYGEFAKDFGLPSPDYLRFAPGGNYILTRERVHRYPIEFYDNLRNLLPYTVLPGEAQMLERTYLTLWE